MTLINNFFCFDFSNPISFPGISLLWWTNLGSKSKRKNPWPIWIIPLDIYVYRVLRRTDADLLNTTYELRDI
jgi:hypothetical protein